MNISFIPFEQPIGFFALAVLKASDIIKIAEIDRLKFDEVILDSVGGPQRESSSKRTKEIAKYAKSLDATFPTPILLALKRDYYRIEDDKIVLNDDQKCCQIVDGQHRILGIEQSGLAESFQIPVVFMLDASEEQKALLFATINGKQRQVSSSIIYELYKVSSYRNPYTTTHQIARAMNSKVDSPFYKRLKMLGKKFFEDETLSQGSFGVELIKHISNKPEDDLADARRGVPLKYRPGCIFNEYFVDGKDEVILKIMLNLFSAIKKVFPDDWNDSSKILTKTTGYAGVMHALPEMFSFGKKRNSLEEEMFVKIFQEVKETMKNWARKENEPKREWHFVNADFPSNKSGQDIWRDLILFTLNKME